ncbi:MAG: 3'(2'),5'-bisphosphate nucleotidase CysQ [Proteobacteria bacterium]|nr:3'(2'),5'-bisphosphate nucleotidase [Pseudomonadota bacterium]NOG60422.1 3'(2'),5'-bisphosphate nucleotidase CysQ [Pseudomonadota bacterium]
MNEIKHEDLKPLADDVRQIASLAGDKILEIYKTDFSVEQKEDKSPLTAADMAAHNTICQALNKLTPDIPILSEESSDISFDERHSWNQYWLVDPLDGTREFIKRNGEFSVNIALIEAHQSILGVIHIPVTKICYSASLNNGAYKHEPDKNAIRINARKTDPDNIIIAGSRSHGNAQQRSFIDNINDPEVLAVGSSLKFCLVAEGAADIYPRFGPTSEWDSAAAQCIVEEAGGIVVDTKFKTLKYNTKESLLNPSFLVISDNSYDWAQYLTN